MYDASAFVGQWPFTASPAPSLSDLLAAYRALEIKGAALSPMPAVLQPEPMTANLDLLRALRTAESKAPTVYPVPVLNPSLATWERDLDLCLQYAGDTLRGVKIVPNYHGYTLEDEAADLLAEACGAHGLAVCVQVRMEDERCHHPRMKVPAVEPTSLAAFAGRHSTVSVLVCGAYLAEFPAYAASPNLVAELSFAESGFVLRDALAALGPHRVALGTHAPLHVIESGIAKLEADEADAVLAADIGAGNFRRLFSGERRRPLLAPDGD